MRADAFEIALARRVTAESARSYLSYARRVEDVLRVDLDAEVLHDDAIDALTARLAAHGIPANSVRNCRSALRAYARFVAGRH